MQPPSPAPYWRAGRWAWTVAAATAIGGLGLGGQLAHSPVLSALAWWTGLAAVLWLAAAQRRFEHFRLAVERELAEGRRELRDYVDHMSTYNAKVGVDGRFLLYNRTGLMASGLTEEKLQQTPFTEGPWFAFDPAVQARVRAAFARAVAGETVQYDEQVLLIDQVLTLSFSLVPVPGGDGRTAYVVAEGRDITQQKQAEERYRALALELESSNAELEAFCFAVSHDLRAPLRRIDGFSHALLEDVGDKFDEHGRNMLLRIRASTAQMAQLIDDLLNLSRVTWTELEIGAVDLSGIARAALDALRAGAPERQVETVVHDGLHCTGDPRLLCIAVENLLGNAWKYSSKQPAARIEFGAERDAAGAFAYFVRDNGAGFDMKAAGKLFGVFQRLHGDAEFPGTGVGLATVKRIIARHQGRIWAQSEIGRGATFFFSLPAG